MPNLIKDFSNQNVDTKWLALLGRRDHPTDALRDYCSFLKDALLHRGILLEQIEVPWHSDGSLRSFWRLWSQIAAWKDRWVLVQYTALSWSRRGFPLRILPALWIMRLRGARCAVVFHDARPYHGGRVIDRLRSGFQTEIMKLVYHLADRCVFTVPLQGIEWLPVNPVKACVIPVGANLCEDEIPRKEVYPAKSGVRTVAVFGLTGGESLNREIRDIVKILQYATRRGNQIRLLVVGRNSKQAEAPMMLGLEGLPIRAEFLGVIPSSEIAKALASADALLFVRGAVSASRSSALAGIACWLPVVGYRGSDTRFPITEAGLELERPGDVNALGRALCRVLCDDELRQSLRRKSMAAHADYFSWTKIAERFQTELLHE